MIEKFLEKDTVNINLDSDGLLSYLFLKIGGFKGHISGYNNSHDLILSIHPTLGEMWDDIFIDIFVNKKESFSIDQHVISNTLEVENSVNKLNPHFLIENHIPNGNYFSKYPFSTCLFILAILEKEKRIGDINLIQPLENKGFNLIDLVLRADGVLGNYVNYNENVKYWAEKLIVFSDNGVNTKKIMDYLLSLDLSEAKFKNDTISNFYSNYGLTNDGGYNPNKLTLLDNIKLLNKILRAFSKHLDIPLTHRENKLYLYKGSPFVTEEWDNLNFDNLDTYAFIRKTKLSYTIDFKGTGRVYNFKIYD